MASSKNNARTGRINRIQSCSPLGQLIGRPDVQDACYAFDTSSNLTAGQHTTKAKLGIPEMIIKPNFSNVFEGAQWQFGAYLRAERPS